MSDWYQDPQNKPEDAPVQPDTPVSGSPATEEPAAAEPVEQPATPPEQPTEPKEAAPPPTYTWTPSGPTWHTPSTQNGWQTPPTYSQPPYQPPANQYGWGAPTPPPTPPKKRKNSTGVLVALVAVLCVACLSVSVIWIMSRPAADTGNSNQNGGAGGNTTQSGQSGNRGEAPPIVTEEPEEEGLSSRDIVANNLDSTVIIKMYEVVSNPFFGQSTEETKAGEATGIVWTADGYIITNAHCVYNEKAGRPYSRIEVELYDGTVLENATVVGYDTTTDLAVIRVNAKTLTPATFGNSDALQLGDRVLALGNNSGLGWTVTGGIVSGLARDVYEETNYAIKCLQVDAVINPGNSGGPLLNSSGQVIGINSAKIVAEGYEGLGFSIPINEAKEILTDLVEHGFVKGRIMLGIEGNTFNRYSGYEGFYITSINNDSCLKGTKAAVGDIITHVNGVRVKDYAEMREQLTSYKVGKQISITLARISRNSTSVDTFDVTVTLMESDGTV